MPTVVTWIFLPLWRQSWPPLVLVHHQAAQNKPQFYSVWPVLRAHGCRDRPGSGPNTGFKALGQISYVPQASDFLCM